MFNEAFWFFYLVSVVEGLVMSAVIVASFSTFGVVACIFYLTDPWDNDAKNKAIQLMKRFIMVVCISTSIAIFTPKPLAFYAGAGQYVGESVELDDTLLNLKKVVDEKVEELLKEETTKKP